MNRWHIWSGLLLWACELLGQTVASPPGFEVASVRSLPATSVGQEQVRVRIGPGRAEFMNVTLKDLVARAYGMRSISGPPWIDTERYAVVAKVPNGVSLVQVPKMLQSLLLERFKLRAHMEKRGGSDIYALVVGKGGAKIRKDEDPAGDDPARQLGGYVTVFGNPGKGRSGFRANALTMAKFAELLEHYLDRPVVDLTQLQGGYNFTVEFATSILTGAKPAADQKIAGFESPAPADDPIASLFTAIQLLGLKLEARKASLEYLVIDYAERVPTEN